MTDRDPPPEPITSAVDVEVHGLDDDATRRFTHGARSTATVFAHIAEQLGIELPRLRLIGTSAFEGTVQALLSKRHGDQEPAYTTERLGGTAMGKNVPLADDHSEVAIVMSAEPWTVDDPRAVCVGTFFLAHEITHAVIGRLRVASGALDGVVFPSVTPLQIARSITRIAVEELRADMVGDLVLSMAASKTVDGSVVPVHISDPDLLNPRGYREQLAAVLTTQVHPGWVDAVVRYRTWHTSLDTLIRTLFSEGEQVMTLVAHAEAEARVDPDAGGLLLGDAVDAPGATWLVGPAWDAILASLNGQAMIPPVDRFKAAELEILAVGERELLKMWERLGVTFDVPSSDSSYQVHVTDPETPPGQRTDET